MNILGQSAIQTYGFPPFVDASCRREPDLQNPNPSISALCRQGIFAPHLKLNDIVIYMTIQGNYPPYNRLHHRLVAILHVVDIYKTHQQGQTEYSKLNLPIPRNCMVDNNPPFDFDKTAGNFNTVKKLEKFLKRPQSQQQIIGQKRIQHWDNNYLQKSQKWTCFVRTKILYRNITDPAPIFRNNFDLIFGKLPNTSKPKEITFGQFQQLSKLAGLDIKNGQKKAAANK